MKRKLAMALAIRWAWIVFLLDGCGGPLRHYKLAVGTGDVTHAIEPGARVVVPNRQPKPPRMIYAMDRPSIDCIDRGRTNFTSAVHVWECPPYQK